MARKASELREKTDSELKEELKNLRAELFNLRLQQATGGLTNPHRIKAVSKDHDRHSVERSIISLSNHFYIAKLDHPFKDVPYGSTMMFFIGFLALSVASKFGQSLPVMGILAGWIIASVMLFENRHELAMMLLNIRLFPLLIILGVSTMLFIFSLHAFSHQLTTLDLGGTC